MATLDQMYQALQRADTAAQAGDASAADDARALAQAISARKAIGTTPQGDGLALNVAAAGKSAAYGLAGAPVDIARSAINSATQAPTDTFGKVLDAVNPLSPILNLTRAASSAVGVPAIPDDTVGSSKWIAQQGEKVGLTNPEDVKAVTLPEKMVRTGTEAALLTAAPELLLAKLKNFGIVGENAIKIAESVLGNASSGGAIVRNALTGAAGGAGATAAAEAAPDNLKPLAATAGALVGGVGSDLLGGAAARGVKGAIGKAGEFLDPMRGQAGIDRTAGRRLASGLDATPAETIAAINAAPVPVSGAKPTLAQATADRGAATMEAAARRVDDTVFRNRTAEQEQARIAMLKRIQKTGGAEDMAPALNQHAKRVDDILNQIDAHAQSKGEKIAADLAAGRKDAATAGDEIRTLLEGQRAAARHVESALYKAVDPDGTLTTGTKNLRDTHARMAEQRSPLAKPLDSEEAAIVEVADNLDATASYKDLVALKTRIGDAMREEARTKGKTAKWGRLSQYAGAVADDLKAPAVAMAKQEAKAVKAGDIAPEDTFLAKVREITDELDRSAAAFGTDGAGNGTATARSSAGSAGPAGAARDTGVGLADVARGEGLPATGGLSRDYTPVGELPDNIARQAARLEVNPGYQQAVTEIADELRQLTGVPKSLEDKAVKAVGPDGQLDFDKMDDFLDAADMFLVNTKNPSVERLSELIQDMQSGNIHNQYKMDDAAKRAKEQYRMRVDGAEDWFAKNNYRTPEDKLSFIEGWHNRDKEEGFTHLWTPADKFAEEQLMQRYRAQMAANDGAPKNKAAEEWAPNPAVDEQLTAAVRQSLETPDVIIDSEAGKRLAAANAATVDRVNTFDNPTLKPILVRPGSANPYTKMSVDVPATIFREGPKGGETVQLFRNAVGDAKALETLEGHIVDSASRAAERADGTIDPKKLDAWRRKHAEALRAFPALDARVSNATTAAETAGAVAAKRRAVVKAEQKSIASKLAGATDPGEITTMVGKIFGRADSVAQMQKLKRALRNNPDANAGLRKAVADHIFDKVTKDADALGTPKIAPRLMREFLDDNEQALKAAGFTHPEIENMRALADEAARAAAVAESARPGQSGPGQVVQELFKIGVGPNSTPTTLMGRMIIHSIGHAIIPFAFGGPFAGLATLVGAGVMNTLRAKGLQSVDELFREALLDPALARKLLVKVTPKNIKPAVNAFRQQLVRSTLGGTAAALVNSEKPN